MITYCVQIDISEARAEEWLVWIGPHADAVVATGCFDDWSLAECVDPAPPPGRRVFVVRYTTTSHERLQQYRTDFAPALIAEGLATFENDLIGTRWVEEGIRV
ncbi:MAG TPA: DUF4286 family protein [Chlorobiota bacterium]|nr:DUF4286 family protein [Chlorobiota bacterium]